MADPKPHIQRPNRPPWWFPDMRGGALMGLFLLTGYILWVSAPERGGEPSEFFKAVAQAVVLTGFLAAIGFLFQSSKGTSEANDRTDKVLAAVTGDTTTTTTTATTKGEAPL
jgi:hypothetical protein